VARVVPATPPVIVGVCATAGGINDTTSGNIKITDLRMRLTTPPPVFHHNICL
jgi:hypothetical protein